MNKWEEVAKSLLESERKGRSYNLPESIGIMLTWRDDNYVGSLQEVALDYSKEIVLLSKSSNPLQIPLAEAIRKLDPSRLEITADRDLALEGRQHVLRRLGNNLTIMTQEQTEYIAKNLPQIYEL